MSGLSLQLRTVTRTEREPRLPARWLVLAYLASDSDLEQALLDDLGEMERVGSRPGAVEILAQVDRGPTREDRAHGRWRNTHYVGYDPSG